MNPIILIFLFIAIVVPIATLDFIMPTMVLICFVIGCQVACCFLAVTNYPH